MNRIHGTIWAIALAAASLLAPLPAAAGTAELIADLNSNRALDPGSSAGGPLIPLGDRLLFQASEPSSGTELWISDATPQGTRLLVDLDPGAGSTSFVHLGTVRRTAILLRPAEFGDWHLWRSDGTPEGTLPIHDQDGLAACVYGQTPEGVALGDRFCFLARKGIGSACSLWVTDGSAAGTRVVEDDLGGSARQIVTAGNRLFLLAGTGLWTSDGRSTVLLRRFDDESEEPRELRAVGSRAAFVAEADGKGEELWMSDGTAAGTRARTDFFEPTPLGSLLAAFGETLYFTASDGTGFDLWRIDASKGAAQRVTDFIDSDPFESGFEGGQLARLGDRLVFPAREESVSSLWVSGGTPATTARLACAGGCPRIFGEPLLTVGGRAVFEGTTANNRQEIWTTDGTDAGTRRLADITVRGTPALLLGKAFFAGPGSGLRAALWSTDGTPAGTARIADLGEGSGGLSPVLLGKRFFFLAPVDRQSQLWVSDGTRPGTRPLSNLSDASGSYPRGFTPFGNGALFSADDGDGRRMWRTDGTAAGTHPLSAVTQPLETVSGSGGVAFVLSGYDRFSPPFRIWRTDGTEEGTFRIDPSGLETLGVLAPFRGGAVFGVGVGVGVGAGGEGSGAEDHLSLWETDGSLSGTRLLLDLPADVSHISQIRALGSRLYLVVRRASSGGYELWASDGTAAGTRSLTEGRLADLDPRPPMALTGGRVYFAAEDRIWKTDGTPEGTVPQFVGPEGFTAADLTAFQGALYFMAETSEARGLWRLDGTPEGTFLLQAGKALGNSAGLGPVRMASLGDRLVFLADDGEHGVEPWSSDGTAAGTALLRDVAPGPASSQSSYPASLTVAGGKVFFQATDGAGGFELWESDGTAAGTRRVQDIAPGALSSQPEELAGAGDRLFFSAQDAIHGAEPWVLRVQDQGCAASATALCLGGRFRVEADWRDFQGHQGRGRAVPLTADTGGFWFFDAANVEVVLKVLDGRPVNGHYWVSYGALTNVQYTLTVTDTRTGAVRQYFNPPGWLGSLADTEAFGPRGATVAGVVTAGPAARPAAAPAGRSGPPRPGTAAGCVPGPERLCLAGGRFAVTARWKLPDGTGGAGRAVPLAGGDTGYLWFFDAGNVEVVLKVLDGRPVNGRFWVFFGALSDVEYTLTVTDTETGAEKTYANPRGRLASVADTGAF
jgi:ELWxxDGT repeat protein